MSLTPADFPIFDQQRMISGEVNSYMLINFLFGIYTVVYGGTVHLYLTKVGASLQRSIVISTITVLYCLCAVFVGIGWYFMNWSLVDNDATRYSIATSAVLPPKWIIVSHIFLRNLPVIVSDGLLMWRCFNLWASSWKVIMVPMLLLLSEIGVIIALTYFCSVDGLNLTSDSLNASAYMISAVASVITTLLIGYRIHRTTRLTSATRFGRFKYLVRILVESAAIYSLFLLFVAILLAVPAFDRVNSVMSAVNPCFDYMVPLVAGMTPTILVARLVTSNSDNAYVASIGNMSALQFQPHEHTKQIAADSVSHRTRFSPGDVKTGRGLYDGDPNVAEKKVSAGHGQEGSAIIV